MGSVIPHGVEREASRANEPALFPTALEEVGVGNDLQGKISRLIKVLITRT